MPTKDEISRFSLSIERFISTTGYDYIEGIIEYCRENNLELEVAASLVSSNLKAKIENAANKRNLLKNKGAILPI